MKGKILGIAIVFTLVSMAFVAFPVTAADPQTFRMRCWDYGAHDGATEQAFYTNLAGTEGWTCYWWDQNDKGIFQGDSADRGSYLRTESAPINYLSYVTVLMDNNYPDPGGWLYNEPVLMMMENATGYAAFSYSAGSPAGLADVAYTEAQLVPVPVGAENAGNVDLTWTVFDQFSQADAALPVVDAHLAGYLVYRTANAAAVNWNDNAAMGTVGDPTAWTLVGGTVAAPITVLTYTDSPGAGTWYYSIKFVCDGSTSAAVANNVASQYGGQASNGVTIGGANTNAISSGLAEAGQLLAGNHATPTVTITASVTDVANEGDNIASAQISVDGGAWVQMTASDGTFNSPTEGVTYTFNPGAGYYATGAHNYQVRGDDGQGGALTPVADTFTIADSTDPTLVFNSQPGATVYANAAANFNVGYEDFTAFNPAVANSYLQYQVNNGSWVNNAWVNSSFAWGSFTNILTYSIPGGTFATGDWVDYDGQVSDSGGNVGLLTGGSFQVLAPAAGVQDPYPVFGYVSLYNGNGAGAYTPITSAGGAAVTVNWTHSVTGLPVSQATTTNALGQYSVDIMNYTDGGAVEITAVFEAPYSNNGYNNTVINLAGVPGGVNQEVICGVPYQVVYNPVLPGTALAGSPVGITYEIQDRDGAIAQGYYTHADGAMNFFTGAALFTNDVSHPLTFDGDGGAVTDGTYTGTVTFNSGGTQYLNISEGGSAEANPYLTPWGSFTQLIGGVVSDGYLNDWANGTIDISSGAFLWHLEVGWNMVCVPMSPTDTGGDGVFGAFDAMREVFDDTGDAACSIATRTGGNPSTYAMFDYGVAEGDGSNFAVDFTHGYWIYATIVGDVSISAINVTNLGVDNVVVLTVGWNLLGFTHNGQNGGAAPGGWTTQLTADDFTDGTVDADLDIAGADTQIIVTRWIQATQWYNSYVVTDTFPGMVDWNYDSNYAHGYFLWSEGADTITFDVTY